MREDVPVELHLKNKNSFIEPKKTKKQKCIKCNFMTGDITKRAKHMKNVHDCNELYTKCELCKFISATKQEMKCHINSMHLNIRQECDMCSFTAKRKLDIANHKLVAHDGMTIVVCEKCSFTSTSKLRLKTHTKCFHNVMLCQVCDCEFRGSIQLKEHKMREHDKKEIDCSQCDFKSVIKKELRQHIRFAHPEETNVCNKCNYRTVWKSEVSSHKRSEHGKKGNHK